MSHPALKDDFAPSQVSALYAILKKYDIGLNESARDEIKENLFCTWRGLSDGGYRYVTTKRRYYQQFIAYINRIKLHQWKPFLEAIAKCLWPNPTYYKVHTNGVFFRIALRVNNQPAAIFCRLCMTHDEKGLEFFADPNNDAEEEILEQEELNDARSDDDTEDERDRMHAIFQSLHARIGSLGLELAQHLDGQDKPFPEQIEDAERMDRVKRLPESVRDRIMDEYSSKFVIKETAVQGRITINLRFQLPGTNFFFLVEPPRKDAYICAVTVFYKENARSPASRGLITDFSDWNILRDCINDAPRGLRRWDEKVVPLLTSMGFLRVNQGVYTMSITNNILLTVCAGLFADACALYRDVPVTEKKRNADDVGVFNKRQKLPPIYIARVKELADTIRKVLDDPMCTDQ